MFRTILGFVLILLLFWLVFPEVPPIGSRQVMWFEVSIENREDRSVDLTVIVPVPQEASDLECHSRNPCGFDVVNSSLTVKVILNPNEIIKINSTNKVSKCVERHPSNGLSLYSWPRGLDKSTNGTFPVDIFVKSDTPARIFLREKNAVECIDNIFFIFGSTGYNEEVSATIFTNTTGEWKTLTAHWEGYVD